MAIFIGALLVILSIGVVVYPFVKSRTPGGGQVPLPDTDADGPGLDALYDAIHTLQLEHQLGNIPQGLYQEQLDSYRVQAAVALKKRMEAQSQDEDWALEQEITLARASLVRLNGHARSCQNCSATVSAALTHCPECNAELSGKPPTSQGEPTK